MNIIIIVFIMLTFISRIIVINANIHVPLLALGTILIVGTQCLYIAVFSYRLVYRQGYTLKSAFKMEDTVVKKLLILTLPILLASAVEQIIISFDRNFASNFGPEAVSALAYATRALIAISGTFITSVLIFTYPKIAEFSVIKNTSQMKKAISESIVAMCLFTIPVIAAVAMFSHPVASLLFRRGAFNVETIAVTSQLLFIYVFALFGHGLIQLITRAFIVIGNFKIPILSAVFTVVMNIIINILLTPVIGITGFALAKSISTLLGFAILLLLLRRKLGGLFLKKTIESLSKITAASVIMAFGAYFIYQYVLPFNAMLALVVAALVGMMIYGVLLLILRIHEVDYLISTAFGYIRKRAEDRRNL